MESVTVSVIGSGSRSIRTTPRTLTAAIGIGAVCCLLSPAMAQVDPASGIDFVTIGAIGNARWVGDGTGGDRALGRGHCQLEYRIGKFEVTTAQWVEFMNAAYDRPFSDRLPHLLPPDSGNWGGGCDT